MNEKKLYRVVYTAFGDIENNIVCQIVGETKKYVIISTNGACNELAINREMIKKIIPINFINGKNNIKTETL